MNKRFTVRIDRPDRCIIDAINITGAIDRADAERFVLEEMKICSGAVLAAKGQRKSRFEPSEKEGVAP